MKKVISLIMVLSIIFTGVLAVDSEVKAYEKVYPFETSQLNHDSFWSGGYFKSSNVYYGINEYPMNNYRNENSPIIRAIEFDKDTYEIGDTIKAELRVEGKYPLDKFSMIYRLPSGLGYIPMFFEKVNDQVFRYEGKITDKWEVGTYSIKYGNVKDTYFILGYDIYENPIVAQNNIFPKFYVKDPTGKKKPLEKIDNKKQKLFESKGVNLRNLEKDRFNEKPFGYRYIGAGQLIEGYEFKNQVVFFYNSAPLKVDKRFVRPLKKKTYISKGVRCRNLYGDEVIDYYPRGKKLVGYEGNKKIYFKDGDKRSYVHKNFIEEDGITRIYKSSGVNVRDMSGNKLGYLKKGRKIKGTRNGSYIEIRYKGKKASVYGKYVY